MKNLFLLALAIVLFSCSDNNDDGPNFIPPQTPGLAYAVSDNEFQTTYTNLRSSLQSSGDTNIVFEVNHTSNAQSVGQELRDTRLIFFSNPVLETPLMQENPLAGLDFPQKMLVYENEQGLSLVGYNSTAYLNSRYNVGGASTVQAMNTQLSELAANATESVVSENSASGITSGQGVFSIVSQNDFLNTYNALRNAISDDPSLSIITEVNHQQNAQSEGLELLPSRVIIFGNAESGTPIMQSGQTAGLDLPLKMLVWQNENGEVKISYSGIEFIAERHGVTGNENTITNIKSKLATLALDASN